MENRLYHLHTLSALHVGTGQGVGAVDLPIARSRASNLPIVPGSAIKGVLRDEFGNEHCEHHLSKENVKILFGAENNDPAHAGAVAFGDAQLLLLPVRSFAGTVAYATCPFILKRYQRDANLSFAIPELDKQAQVISDSLLLLGDKIALEDLDMDAQKNAVVSEWAQAIAQAIYPDDETWQAELTQRFVVLPDDVFSFLADTATEIRMRIKIDQKTRIVQNGALWSEENLPCETVLWGVFGVGASRDKNNPKSAQELNTLLPEKALNIQIGGKHTVGRGLCRLLMK
ncbi:type III-B CRISPR module RAMP protein Cmr4 [Suttonella indologenes]|uniref:CRISPR type III-B/RAMP module RAMP protein Cmr4 n=1 Tax=Suttonella indologenes TaxID=13276 RepID=A0A380N311_9GAMM|nr:type III-B CRISPR module RAMP protein Cmr4 [Suttonella indologenes]SUO98666.1 CRISPR type III-B/RAMP module RAMP protein Cmr4 [Suttonella indologenes]